MHWFSLENSQKQRRSTVVESRSDRDRPAVRALMGGELAPAVAVTSAQVGQKTLKTQEKCTKTTAMKRSRQELFIGGTFVRFRAKMTENHQVLSVDDVSGGRFPTTVMLATASDKRRTQKRKGFSRNHLHD